jgi:hypothetical protein
VVPAPPAEGAELFIRIARGRINDQSIPRLQNPAEAKDFLEPLTDRFDADATVEMIIESGVVYFCGANTNRLVAGEIYQSQIRYSKGNNQGRIPVWAPKIFCINGLQF